MIRIDTSIYIRDLRLYAFHGVMPQERKTGGWFVVSLRVHYNIMGAMESDDVADTLNYAELCNLVKREMAVPSNLLEHVAGRIGESIFREMAGVTSVDIELCKVNPPMGADCDGASVELHLTSEKTEETV